MSSTDQRWFHRRGTLARDGWESVVDDRIPGWQHTGLRVAELSLTDSLVLAPAGVERIVVPLSGSFIVTADDGAESWTTRLNGRATVFDGPTDALYLSCAVVGAVAGEGRVAVASSPTRTVKPTRYIPAREIPVELRGAGASSRQVQDLASPQTLDADRLIVCEVITPAGNWSSYPPHKHDERRPGQESRLEEIYYFESAPARGDEHGGASAAAFGLFSAYSSPVGEIEIDAMVRTGDIALVPHGYHGPAAAAPGYDLYYLNVMAGPDPTRAWLISDDPAHAWARSAWETLPLDSRLPYGTDQKGRLR